MNFSQMEDKMKTSLSLVMPFYNEIEYLQMTIAKAQNVLNSLEADYEIILVNDASFDGSETIALKLAAGDSRIKVFQHDKNKGLGAALKTGFNKAKKNTIVYTDVDMPFDFSILKDAVTLLEETDVVHGYRVGKRESFLRTVYSRTYNFLIRIIFGYKTNDINFAMTIFKRDVLDKISLSANGSFISAEFLLKSYYNGFKVINIPVTFNQRKYGRSHLASLSNISRTIYEIIKYYPEIRSLYY